MRFIYPAPFRVTFSELRSPPTHHNARSQHNKDINKYANNHGLISCQNFWRWRIARRMSFPQLPRIFRCSVRSRDALAKAVIDETAARNEVADELEGCDDGALDKDGQEDVSEDAAECYYQAGGFANLHGRAN
jgi:hypothetical protein